MNSEVHIPIGLAAAGVVSLFLPVMQPDSMEAGISVAVCGTVGALTPDIDANGNSKMKREFRKFMLIIVMAVFLGARYGEPLNILSGFGVWNVVGLVALIGCYIYGYMTKHRGFTHELRGLIAFCVPAFLLLGAQEGLWFLLGLLSHQFADMCNYGKIHWLNPVPVYREVNFSRGWFKGSSLQSQLIGLISWIIVIGVFYLYLKR